MIATILSAKKLKLRTLFLPFVPSIPSIEIPGLETVYIETIQDVIDVVSGQQLLPFVRVIDREEEPKKSDRDFNQYIGVEAKPVRCLTYFKFDKGSFILEAGRYIPALLLCKRRRESWFFLFVCDGEIVHRPTNARVLAVILECYYNDPINLSILSFPFSIVLKSTCVNK
jgi:hypothetical protein